MEELKVSIAAINQWKMSTYDVGMKTVTREAVFNVAVFEFAGQVPMFGKCRSDFSIYLLRVGTGGTGRIQRSGSRNSRACTHVW